MMGGGTSSWTGWEITIEEVGSGRQNFTVITGPSSQAVTYRSQANPNTEEQDYTFKYGETYKIYKSANGTTVSGSSMSGLFIEPSWRIK